MSAVAVVAKHPFTLAMEGFCVAWKATYEAAYVPSPAECSQLRMLVQRLPISVVDELPAIFGRYLQDLDPFVAQTQRHSLMWFCTRGNGINKYRTRAPVVSVKEARTMETLRNWKERHSNGIDK